MENVKSEFEGLAFGLADGVICFLGILIGVAAATSNTNIVIIAGVVGGIADAFGNSIGFYISQAMERGIQTHRKKEKKHEVYVHSYSEVVMNASYSFIGTLIVLAILLAPFLFFDLKTAAIMASVVAAVLLFVLGVYVSTLMGESALKTGTEFAAIGIIGALLSYAIGAWLKTLLST